MSAAEKTSTKVFVLYDTLYDNIRSTHASLESAEREKKRIVAEDVPKDAKQWWDDFGPDGRLSSGGREDMTWKKHLADERAAVRRNLHIEEHDVRC